MEKIGKQIYAIEKRFSEICYHQDIGMILKSTGRRERRPKISILATCQVYRENIYPLLMVGREECWRKRKIALIKIVIFISSIYWLKIDIKIGFLRIKSKEVLTAFILLQIFFPFWTFRNPQNHLAHQRIPLILPTKSH